MIYELDDVKTIEPARLVRLLERIPAQRAEKIESLKNAGAKSAAFAAWALLQLALGREFAELFAAHPGIEPANGARARIAVSASGKPYFPDWPGIEFSISHSPRAVMCVVDTQPVGCDVESVGRFARASKSFAQRVFSEREVATLAGMGADDRVIAMCRLWTAKEALAKQSGEGIGREGLKRDMSEVLEAELDGNGLGQVQASGLVFELHETPGYVFCSCAERALGQAPTA